MANDSSRLSAWKSAVKREQLALRNLSAAQALFDSGGPNGVENWGAVAAANDALVVARKNSTAAFKRCHELAAQTGLKFPDESDVDDAEGEKAGDDGEEAVSARRGSRAPAATH